MAKTLRAKIVKKLDELWSKIIHKLYGRCMVCGAKGVLHAHHCIVNKGRGGYGVRWIIENGILLCPTCHLFKIHHGQADKRWLDYYISVLDSLIPKEKQDEIIKLGHTITKFSTQELSDKVALFLTILKNTKRR